jgi:hypothetical protein
MTAHNVGALVVLKSGDMKQLAGIVTERGKLKAELFRAGQLESK